MPSFTPVTSLTRDLATGAVDFDTDAFGVMLLTSAASPSKLWAKRSDVTNEVSTSGTGYTSGNTVTATVGAADTTNHRTDVSLGGTSYSSASISARYAVYFKKRGGAASADELVGWVDFDSTVTSTNDTWTLTASMLRLQN